MRIEAYPHRFELGPLILLPFSLTIERLDLIENDFGGVRESTLRTLVSVVSTVTGEQGRLSFGRSLRYHPEDGSILSPQDRLVSQVRHALIEIAAHEIDECLRYADGRHVRDPHANERVVLR